MFNKFLHTKELDQWNIRVWNINPFPLHFACVVGNNIYSPNNPICLSLSLGSVVVIKMTIYHQVKYIPRKLLHIKISHTLNEKQNTVFSPVYNLSLGSVVFSSFLWESIHCVECLISCWKCSAFPVLNVSRVARLVELRMFVGLFRPFRPTWEFFNSFGDVTIAGEGLQILAYSRHLWPLSSEGSLACHNYCGKGHPFIMVIFEDPWHSHLMPSVWQWSCHYLF